MPWQLIGTVFEFNYSCIDIKEESFKRQNWQYQVFQWHFPENPITNPFHDFKPIPTILLHNDVICNQKWLSKRSLLMRLKCRNKIDLYLILLIPDELMYCQNHFTENYRNGNFLRATKRFAVCFWFLDHNIYPFRKLRHHCEFSSEDIQKWW